MAGLDPIALMAALNQGQNPGVPGQLSPLLQGIGGLQQGGGGLSSIQGLAAGQPQQGQLSSDVRDRLALLLQGLTPQGLDALRGGQPGQAPGGIGR